MYNPLTNKYPQGAAEVGEPFVVDFPLPEDTTVTRVYMCLSPLSRAASEQRVELSLVRTERGERVFSGVVTMHRAGIWQYRFEGESESGLHFFGRASNGVAVRGDWLPNWQLTVTERGYKTPNWVKGGIIYHVFVDRFARSGKQSFTKKSGTFHKDWNELPEVAAPGKDYRADDFFGGDLLGITQKLPYLAELGVTLLYLSPVFESISNHRYDTGDYLKIDELLGTEEDFANLVSEAKKLGIDVMLDGVFNHTGADSLYFNKWGNYPTVGAYQDKHSPYHDWYYFKKFPDDYHSWWGITVVPTVNKASEGYRKLIFGEGGVLEKWTKLGVRAWRLDVVDELPQAFVTELRTTLKKLNRDELVIGEVWEDASTKVSYGTMRPYFLGKQLDGVMNYPFKNAILQFAEGGSVAGFCEAVTSIVEHYPAASLATCMTLVGTHDTVRALTALSGHDAEGMTKADKMAYELTPSELAVAIPRMKLASFLQYTLPGVPSVYYGDEAGVQGFEDPTNRKTYPWGHENEELLAHYRRLGKMRSRYRAELSGDIAFVADEHLLVFTRGTGDNYLTIVANNTPEAQKFAFSGSKSLTDGEDATIIAPFDYKVYITRAGEGTKAVD